MADPRAFAPVGPFTLGELAGRAGAEVAAGVDRDVALHDIAPRETAGPDTMFGDGTMIDNLVQIGHNIVIGLTILS